MADDDLTVTQAAKLIAQKSGRPMSGRGVQKAIESGALTATPREVVGQPRPMLFLSRAEVEHFAERRKMASRRGPLTKREQQARDKGVWDVGRPEKGEGGEKGTGGEVEPPFYGL